MKTYISLLRGINVSGQKKIKMEDLRKLYENIGFQGVKSYIQSGNLIFQSDDDDIGTIQEKILIITDCVPKQKTIKELLIFKITTL